MAQFEVGSDFAGHRLEAIIGRGGMGVVYRARDLVLDRVVALKVIAPEFAGDRDFRERFKRESQLAASIRHPNVISIYRAGEEGDQLFITMDYVEGTDLKAIIGVRGRLDPKLAADLISQIASGLDAAHGRGLVHRDVKPANVLIESQANRHQAYLTDFGLTKRATTQSALTRTGMVVGTTDYLAPEQIEGGSIDARADVYALGCVLYEALTGSIPFPRETDVARMWAHVTEDAPSILQQAPGVSPDLDAVVRRAMAKNPNERFLSAEEMGQAVLAAAQAPPKPHTVKRTIVPATDVSPAQAAERPSRPGGQPQPPRHVKRKSRRSEGAPGTPGRGTPRAGASGAAPPGAGAGGGAAPPGAGATRAGMTSPGAPGSGVTRAGATVGGPPAAPPAAPRNRRTLLGVGLGLAAVVILALVLLSGGGGGDDGGEQAGSPAAEAAIPLPDDLAWQSRRKAPVARQYAASTVVGGTIWVLGGLGVKTSSTTTKAYDPALESWRTGPGLPLPLHHVAAVTYNGEPVVIGGWVPSGSNLTAETSDRVFALRNGSWVELPKLNNPRAAAGAAVVGDKIVVVGGQGDGELVAPTEVFDGSSWKEAAEIPTPREHMAAASDGDYVYAVGGRQLAADKNSGALERYDPDSDSWEKLPGMPTVTGSLSATVVGGRLVTVGGESTTSASDAVQGFDIQARKWSKLPSLPSPRHGVALGAIGDALYSIGGAAAAGHLESTSTVEVLDFAGGSGGTTTAGGDWRDLRDVPSPRQYAAATAVGGTIWLLGGLEAETSSTGTFTYDPTVDSWSSGPALPLPLHHVAAVTYKDEPVVIGGWVPEGSNLTAKTSGDVYALRNGSWVELPKLNHPRAAAGAAVVGDKIVVVGGQGDGELVAEAEVFDGKRWKDAAEIPTPREHLGAASDGRYVYAAGGRELGADKNVGALERYDPSSDSWKRLPDMPTVTGSVAAAVAGGQLVTVGGESTTGASDVVQGFDLRARKWSKLSSLPAPSHGVTLAVNRNSLYALGGAGSAGHVDSLTTAIVLDFG